MRIQKRIILGFAVVLTITSIASAQRRPVPARADATGVAIALQVGSQPYNFHGNAVCQHEPLASIYNVKAELWSVEQNDGDRSMRLTLWHPRSGSGDMFSLSVSSGGKSYVVNTVNAGPQSSVRGSGKVSVTNSGAGGTFSINATAPNGAAITGAITCSAFTGVMAEGG